MTIEKPIVKPEEKAHEYTRQDSVAFRQAYAKLKSQIGKLAKGSTIKFASQLIGTCQVNGIDCRKLGEALQEIVDQVNLTYTSNNVESIRFGNEDGEMLSTRTVVHVREAMMDPSIGRKICEAL